MTRIATYGANQLYIARILEVQQRVQKGQLQVSTEKKSPVYSGIAQDTNRLINFENEKATANRFIQTNAIVETKLKAASESIDAVRDSIKTFKGLLENLASGNVKDRAKIEAVQKFAFQGMTEMSAYLGVNVDGQYLFSGGRVSRNPVELPASSLAEFQSRYDGFTNTYPTTRSAHLQDLSLSSSDIGTLTLDYTNGLIKGTKINALENLAAGSRITVAGTSLNNKDFTVRGHVPTNVAGNPLTETSNASTANTFLTYSDGASTLSQATTGNLAFAFDTQGRMTITPGTANSLSPLTEGMKFTIRNTTDNNADGNGEWDGAYVVVANSNGVVTVVNDTDMGDDEKVTGANLTLLRDTADADVIPEATAGLGLAASDEVNFTVSGNTVTMTVPATATDLTTLYAVGDSVTIRGTSGHDGTFRVSARTATTLSFQVNPDAVRVSQLIPQSGRTDVGISWGAGTALRESIHYGSLTFQLTTSGETITAATADAFRNPAGDLHPPVGTIIKLDSTSGVNDGNYKVKSNDGTNIVIESTVITPNGVANETSATASITSTSWYKGDTMVQEHRMDVNRSVEFGIYASDPAFEKAMRAMGIIAQGVFGTAGGLDQNSERIQAARFLLEDALDGPAPGTAPYGTEQAGDVEQLVSELAVTERSIKTASEKHQSFIGFLDTRIIEMENVDKTQAIALLLDDQRALEAGYQALASVRKLSLMDYLK